VRQENIPNFIWFLAGVGMGAAAGVMLAPRSGAETRRMLSRGAGEASGYVTAHGQDYLDYGRELYDKGRQLADEAADMFEEGRRLMEKTDAAEASL
jgi:gas vesicle protein